MSEKNYQIIASTTDIPLGKTQCVSIDNKEILLCNSKEGLFAVDNLCTHADARLSEGKLKGCKIICPLHGAAFDIRDGAALSKPARISLGTYSVKIEDNNILIEI